MAPGSGQEIGALPLSWQDDLLDVQMDIVREHEEDIANLRELFINGNQD